MKKLIFLLIICFCKESFAKKQMAEYADLINEAELLICMDKPDLALQHFDRAFAVKIPLGKDLLNSLICASLVNDTTLFKTYATALIKNGAFSDGSDFYLFFDKVDNISDKEKYKQIWRSLAQKTPVHIDTVYRSAVAQLVKEDQDVRHYFIRKQSGNYNTIGRDSLNVFDSLNILKLKSLFSAKGYPTEAIIGYDHSVPGNPPIYEVIIRHDRAWTNRKVLDSILYQATRNGDLSPSQYGYWKDQSYWAYHDSASAYQLTPFSHYGTDALTIINDTLYIYKYLGAEKEAINAARKEIYADHLDEMAVKANYQFSHKYFRLIDGTYAIWNGLPEEQIQKTKREAYTAGELETLRKQLIHKCVYGLKHN